MKYDVKSITPTLATTVGKNDVEISTHTRESLTQYHNSHHVFRRANE
jgi:hypothetical protein